MALNGRTNGNSEITHPVRVLHLIEHLKVGGAERVVADLVQTLDKKRVQNIVCLYREIGSFGIDLQSAGYHIVFIRKDLLTHGLPKTIAFLRPFPVLIESMFFIIRLARVIRRHKIQVVHSHMFSANLWGRLASVLGGRPAVITTEHNVNGKLGTLKHRIINRMLAPLSDRIVAVSQQVAEAVVSKQNLPQEKLIVIHNGIRINALDEPDTAMYNKRYQEFTGSRPRIISVGRLVAQKRHDLLLEALKVCAERVPSISCWIIGDGPERGRLEQLTQELNLTENILFLGERTDARSLLQHADIFVNTSDWEGFPITLLEAMAAGLPIVATNVGGNREIIQTGETGILVEPGNAQAIAIGICQMIANPKTAKKMGQRGQEEVREFYDITKVSLRWEKLYEEVLVGRGKF